MPYISISTEVDVEIDYRDFNANDLAKILVTKPNYQAALDKALNPTKASNKKPDEIEDDEQIKSLVEAFRSHKPVEAIIARIAFSRYGMVC